MLLDLGNRMPITICQKARSILYEIAIPQKDSTELKKHLETCEECKYDEPKAVDK